MAASELLVRAALRPRTFRFVDQLSSYLSQHFVLHEPGRFLIIPKPYGVSCTGEKSSEGGVFKSSQYNRDNSEGNEIQLRNHKDDDVTISDCIPALSAAFREPRLHFCVGLKRYLSGAIVLPASDAEFKNLTNSMKFVSQTTHSLGDYHYRCLSILLGSPPQDSGSFTGYTTFQRVGQHTEYIFVPGKSSKRAKSGKFAVEGTVEYRVLAKGHGCSLVEFGVNKFARHLPRLVFSHLMCPILGDPLYTPRLVEIDGAPVLMNPGQMRKKTKQWFPKALVERLGTTSTQLLKSTPLFCHVYQTTFPRFGWSVGRPNRQQDVMDLLASTPPPSHFLAMAELLEMHSCLAAFLRGDDEVDFDQGAVHGDTVFL